MTVVAPPPQDDRELLIREARARQRRRWLLVAAGVAILAATVLGVTAIVAQNPGNQQTGGLPTPVGALPRCGSTQLHASWRGIGAYTGHSITSFALTNVSDARCTLRGRPKVQLVMQGGRLRPGHVYRARNARPGFASAVPVQTIVLRTGGAASFNVVVVDQVGRAGPIPSKFCAWSRSILVTPPGARSAVRVHFGLSNCGLGVTPLVAGRIDRYSLG
jgi:hypothetical protein